jgi:hypothetical protein
VIDGGFLFPEAPRPQAVDENAAAVLFFRGLVHTLEAKAVHLRDIGRLRAKRNRFA